MDFNLFFPFFVEQKSRGKKEILKPPELRRISSRWLLVPGWAGDQQCLPRATPGSLTGRCPPPAVPLCSSRSPATALLLGGVLFPPSTPGRCPCLTPPRRAGVTSKPPGARGRGSRTWEGLEATLRNESGRFPVLGSHSGFPGTAGAPVWVQSEQTLGLGRQGQAGTAGGEPHSARRSCRSRVMLGMLWDAVPRERYPG